MSNYQQRDNSGQLFKVEEKKNEKGPDYSGTALIDGVEFYMDSWLKTAESGRRWMSFSFKAKQQPANNSRPAEKAATQPIRSRDDDSIPF